ncbi:deoxyribose-phosphate aldolase [Hahella sp. SMD15-11]|uniref:Deoxyribose-phosphate aldolase n=1 Tax=Thermohahella caldifontis TaxID=3142973 RepID=A0AB39UY33_9GAMM
MSGENRLSGVPYAPDWFDDIHVDGAAVQRRINRLMGSRSVKGEAQVAWLLKAISLIDLTTLSGDDTPGRVRRLCAKARRPVNQNILDALGVDWPVQTAAVCVYHEMLGTAAEALAGTNIQIAAVSTGFPAGLTPFELRVREVEMSVAAGATEIDIVISRRHVLTGNWRALYDEVRAYREACGDAHLKAILATGELGTLTNVARASMVCMMAGADFIKTSTGKEPVNATLPVSLVMLRQIREFRRRTGQIAGFKPAGGISTAKDALSWLILVKEELGPEWLRPDRFRFGASSLLGDIERQLEHAATGGYSVAWHHAMG